MSKFQSYVLKTWLQKSWDLLHNMFTLSEPFWLILLGLFQVEGIGQSSQEYCRIGSKY